MARCTKIIDADTEQPKYVIHVKQFAKFVVNLHKNLAPTDIEEGMRVGYVKYLLYCEVDICLRLWMNAGFGLGYKHAIL